MNGCITYSLIYSQLNGGPVAEVIKYTIRYCCSQTDVDVNIILTGGHVAEGIKYIIGYGC